MALSVREMEHQLNQLALRVAALEKRLDEQAVKKTVKSAPKKAE